MTVVKCASLNADMSLSLKYFFLKSTYIKCLVPITLIFILLYSVLICFFFRGIDVVRNKIKMFAQQKLTLPKSRHKIIILDEADRLLSFIQYFSRSLFYGNIFPA